MTPTRATSDNRLSITKNGTPHSNLASPGFFGPREHRRPLIVGTVHVRQQNCTTGGRRDRLSVGFSRTERVIQVTHACRKKKKKRRTTACATSELKKPQPAASGRTKIRTEQRHAAISPPHVMEPQTADNRQHDAHHKLVALMCGCVLPGDLRSFALWQITMFCLMLWLSGAKSAL